MISKTQIKYLVKLRQKKFRKLHGEFLIEGKKIVQDALESSFKIKTIWTIPENKYLFEKFTDLPIEEISNQQSEQISTLKNPEGVFALVEIPDIKVEIKNGPVLLLDFIQDPGNLGTIIRTADWFGFKAVICSNNTVDVFNSKTIQAAKGSIFHIPVVYTDLVNWINKHANFDYYATTLKGSDIKTVNFSPQKTALIIGNEANGISNEILNKTDKRITISKKGQAESLNAAIAASISCFSING
jgi:TrmH family RNA methyltransferase